MKYSSTCIREVRIAHRSDSAEAAIARCSYTKPDVLPCEEGTSLHTEVARIPTRCSPHASG
eukprot:5522268-Amphidinium_carterae.1